MIVTIQQDRIGNLQIWKGEQPIKQVAKYLYHNDKGEESELYIQNDVEDFLDGLPLDEDERINIEFGYATTVKGFPSEYFD